ncbi:hypothetical protein ACFYO9_37470 [Streptomyces sp. NPDC005863]|uniref:hypothetical protein n=1 Tax=Streptomyces sp. NPDC005863 TaxID=3364735 RepID=UPI0036A12CAF
MPTRYRRRPTPVLAVQWTGVNEAELRKFAGFRFALIDDNEEIEVDDIDATARLLDETRGDWMPLVPGDWVVRCRGRYTAVRTADFAKDYELDEEQP